MRKVIAISVVFACLVACEDKNKQAPQAAGSAPVGSATSEAQLLLALAASPAVPQTPDGLPGPTEPAENPVTADKVSLGWALFFDKRISKDGSMACESCHHTDSGWATHNATDAKVGGGKNKRNGPSVQNLAYNKTYYWDGRMPTLEAVSNAAWKGQLGAEPADVAKKLNDIPGYKARFQRAFKSDATAENVPKALGAFLFALKNGNAPFDKFQKGDKTAIGAEAQHGYKLFASNGCTNCHQPPLFTDGLFHNAGIGTDKPEADQDKGRTDATKDATDDGKFKTPSLRDVAKSGPYFHDGSVATLDDAIKTMTSGGVKNAKLDPLLKAQTMSDKDRADLKAFLESLSGSATFNGPPPEMP